MFFFSEKKWKRVEKPKTNSKEKEKNQFIGLLNVIKWIMFMIIKYNKVVLWGAIVPIQVDVYLCVCMFCTNIVNDLKNKFVVIANCQRDPMKKKSSL